MSDGTPPLVHGHYLNSSSRKFLSKLHQVIATFLSNLHQVITTFFSNLHQVITTFLSNLHQVITTFLSNLHQVITTFLSNLHQVITTFFFSRSRQFWRPESEQQPREKRPTKPDEMFDGELLLVEDIHKLDPRYKNCLNSHDYYLEKQFKLRKDMLH